MIQRFLSALQRAIRLALYAAAITGMAAPGYASAHIMVLFHSFNGTLLFGRFPHAFIELTGTRDADGRPVHENYGYTPVTISPAILSGNVAGTIYVEDEKYLKTTNVHFAVPISDAQYGLIREEVARWRDAPGKAYSLQTHNCISFVARIAELVGLKAAIPADMIKRPKAWLNYVGEINPQLHARLIP